MNVSIICPDPPYIRQAEREGMPGGWELEDSAGHTITMADPYYCTDGDTILCPDCCREWLEDWFAGNQEQLLEIVGLELHHPEDERELL